ncbi:MAG: GNAT family N-acetyltransferase [Aggregatilineales bacterium]
MTATERRALTLRLAVTFRPAERDDLPNLEWHGEYTHFRRVFRNTFDEQRAGRRLMLLADVNGYPIGQVFIQLESADDWWQGGRRAYLYSLRVMDIFQHHGIGTSLIQEAERLLSDRDYDSISIAVAKDNPGARRLYERLGYGIVAEDSGRWQYIDHEGRTRHVAEPCWILEKWLRD